jgi:hypothetical protein
MSFDVHFQPCRYDGTTEKRVNPFTKQLQEFPRNQPLSAAQVQAVLAVLKRAGASGPDANGCHVVRFDDGGSAEVFARDLGQGCMFAVRGAGITPSLAQLLFDVMAAGDWVIARTDEDRVVIAPSKNCLRGAPSDFGQVVVAASGQEVAALLSGGFGAWKEYRDKVLSSEG